MAEGRFDEFVATEIAACFLKHSQGRINYTKLIKMMYIVERYAIKKWGYTLTHDDLFWLKQGPILSRTLDLIRHDDFAKVIWSDFIERHGYDVVLRSDPGREHLSDIVIETIDAVWEKFGGLDWKAIVEVLHSQLPEKRDLVDGSDRISINELVSGDDPVSDQRVREIHDYHYALSLCSLDSVQHMLQAALDPCKMGSVFWMHDPLYGSRAIPHPYIVISQVDARGIVLLANLTDALNTDDHACCFEAGEHPLLTKKSAVNYGEVMEAPVSTLRELNHESPGRFHRTPFSPEMVKRIQLGLLESRHAKPVFKNVVRALLESGIDDVSAEV